MKHEEAYEELLGQLRANLATVETDESVLQFSRQAANSIRIAAKEIPEFYIGEFFQMLGSAVLERVQTGMAEGKQVIKDEQMEAAAASVELSARHAAARATGDRAAQHAVWRDREKIQAANQAKIDAATARLDVLGLQLKAVTTLQSTLGIK